MLRCICIVLVFGIVLCFSLLLHLLHHVWPAHAN